MNVTKNPNGSYTVATIINGYRVAKTYYGYTRKESVKLFKNEYLKG